MTDVIAGKTIVGSGVHTPFNPTYGNDADDGTWTHRGSYAAGAGTYTTFWTVDLGAPTLIESMTVTSPSNAFFAWTNGTRRYYHSADGVAWTEFFPSESVVGRVYTYDFSSFTDRYLRLGMVEVIVGIEFRSNAGFSEWTANAGATPPPPPPGIDFDIYDPDGTFIVSLDDLLEKKIRVELNGDGEGHFVIHRSNAAATAANLQRGNVVRVTFTEIDPDPIWEFLITEGDFALISSDEDGGEELSFGGPGTLAVLRNAIVHPIPQDHPTDPDPTEPWERERGSVVWLDQEAGNIIRRLIQEAEVRGVLGPGTYDITKTFDATEDSNGVTWTPMGSWKAPIGGNLHDEVMRLVAAGQLHVEMAVGLILNLYQTIGVDRTSATFATGKVRFVKAVNVSDQLSRAMPGGEFASHAIVQGSDGSYEYANLASYPYAKEKFVTVNSADDAVMEAAGDESLGTREEAMESLHFAVITPYPGDPVDEANGIYLPGPVGSANGKYWPGDLITLDTGAAEFDYEDATHRIYAITLYEDETGHLAPPIVELNSPFLPDGDRSGLSSLPTAITNSGTSGGSSGPHYHTGYAPLDSDGQVPSTYLGTGGGGLGTKVLSDAQTWIDIGAALPWFDVTTYGATGDGTTDDTSDINLAIADLNAADRGVLYFPAGAYKTTTALTAITAGVAIIRGDGMASFDYTEWGTSIVSTSATAVLFTMNGKYARFENLGLLSNSGGTPSAGTAILTDSAYVGQRTDYDSVHVRGFYDGIDVKVGAHWTMHGSVITAPVRYGVRIRNTVNDDAGDWVIAGCYIAAQVYNATSAIRVESSGGGKIVASKINETAGGDRFTKGIDLAIGAGTSTSVLTVTGCSFENLAGDAISIVTTSTGLYGLVSITGCQFGLYTNNTGRAIKISAATNGALFANGSIGGVVLDGLTMHTDGTARAAIELVNTNNVVLGDLVISGFNARYTSSGDTNTTDGGGGGAPTGADYLVGTSQGGLSAEIVVGATPGGELGGTWASPTVDATHSGSAHVTTLDGLSDVVVNSPVAKDRLRYNGSTWANSDLHWEAMVDYDGLVMLDSAGLNHVHEVSH